MSSLQEQRIKNRDLLIRYVNSFNGCYAKKHSSDELLWVMGLNRALKVVNARLESIEEWLKGRE